MLVPAARARRARADSPRWSLIFSALLVLVLAVPVDALAGSIGGGVTNPPTASVGGTRDSDGEFISFDLSVLPVDANDPQNTLFSVEPFQFGGTAMGWMISSDPENPIMFDADPQIVYSGQVVDFGAPSSFGFIFSQSIVPTSTPGIATHSHSSSTSDGGSDGVTATAVAPPVGIPVDADATPEIAVYTVSINGGTSFLNPGLDLSPSFFDPNSSGTQGPFSEGPVPGPAGSGVYDTMRVDVNFSLSGGQDAYTFNGIATIVPEPGSVWLGGLGLGLLAALRRRQRR